MKKFNPGDKVAFVGIPIRYTREYFSLLREKVGIVYRYDGVDPTYLYVFYPELPGCGCSSEDKMLPLCYGVYAKDLAAVE